ncbi:MAG: hypothetical protein P4L42_04250 [Desulfocapsaceae bacterium]|nr:hypothetical protein [Desulfosporosinus sp.]MDR3629526.1 hypothetical protein [Desulfocapsaceae bacterium]
MRKRICLGAIPLLLLGGAQASVANVNSLTAGVSLGLDMDRYSFKGAAASGFNNDYNRMILTPTVDFKSDDVTNGMEFIYSPGFQYDLNGKGTDVNHNLNFSAHVLPAKEWQIRISDIYINSDDSTQTTSLSPATSGANASNGSSNGTVDQVSNQLGRQRFWTNASSVASDYTYLPDSVVTLGYTYSVLRNDGGSAGLEGYQDYNKHDALLSASYRFHPEWKAIASGEYIRGLFSTTGTPTLGTQSDLSEYIGNVRLESYIMPQNTFSLMYGYMGTKYDQTDMNNTDIHSLTAGWKRNISPHLNFDIGGGPSYVKTESQAGNWGYNAHALLNYLIEHGQLGIDVEKAYSMDTFSGTSNGGTIDTWSVTTTFNYQLLEDLSTGLFASYQDQDHQDALLNNTITNYKERQYQAGATLNYNFLRYYTLTVGYTFTRLDPDTTQITGYDENRVYLMLSAKNELLRW